ncbi:MAG: hypothetical protein ACI8PZ_001631 [Myxococcota bacterium]|jgi:hypothetical protein
MPEPLYNPDDCPELAPAAALHAAHRFLGQCRAWANNREIPKRAARVAEGAGPDEAARLHAWVSMVAFIDHAVRELEDGTLDHWFQPDVAAAAPAPEQV